MTAIASGASHGMGTAAWRLTKVLEGNVRQPSSCSEFLVCSNTSPSVKTNQIVEFSKSQQACTLKTTKAAGGDAGI